MKTVALLVDFSHSSHRNHLWDGLTAAQTVRHTLASVLPDAAVAEIGAPETVTGFLEALVLSSQGYDEVLLCDAVAPLLLGESVTKLLDLHRRYHAEYTFADGYPAGLTPEVFQPQILPTLVEWSRKSTNGKPNRETLFQVLSTDMNRFDVETHLSPVDLRIRRLSFTADSLRGVRLLQRVWPWKSLPEKELLLKMEQTGSLVRILPATLRVQITNGVRQLPLWSPQTQFDPSALTNHEFLERSRWNALLDAMLSFAGELTVMPSFWGEPSLHPEVIEFFEDALAKPGLKLCVETSGLGWSEADLRRLSAVAGGKIDWIVELDSLEEATYRALRGEGLAQALATTTLLLELFPGRVWPQTVRMKDNEAEMESFYKHWKSVAGQVIIQKHNHFSGRLPSLKPADLSPWARHPCWHAARDLAVFLDGTTVPCLDDFDRTLVLGNAYQQSPQELWAAGEALFERHLRSDYPLVCRNCDEYYTFAF